MVEERMQDYLQMRGYVGNLPLRVLADALRSCSSVKSALVERHEVKEADVLRTIQIR